MLGQLVSKGRYASEAEAIRAAINRLIIDEQRLERTKILESEILVNDYKEFSRYVRSARFLIVSHDPKTAVSRKLPLMITAFGVKIGGIELAIRYVIHLDRDEDFIEAKEEGTTRKDTEGDPYTGVTYRLIDGQKILVRDYAAPDNYRSLKEKEPDPRLREVLIGLDTYKEDPTLVRLDSKIRNESGNFASALEKCRLHRLDTLLCRHKEEGLVLVGTQSEDIERIETIRAINTILRNSL
jgi:hypothetical protein